MLSILLLAAMSVVTPQEAQSLPIAELAQRILGAAGALVIDVQRPAWPVCEGICGPQVPHPAGPPPVNSLTFYTRAFSMYDPEWSGVCHATAIQVSFDQRGAIVSLSQSYLVGSLGNLTRGTPRRDLATPSAPLEATKSEDQCHALPTTRNFVQTTDPVGGESALIAVSLIHDSMANDGPITIACTNDWTPSSRCDTKSNLRALAENVTVAQVTGIDRVDPRIGSTITGKPAEGDCYDVSLTMRVGVWDRLYLCVRAADSLSVTHAFFNRSRVVY